MGKLNSKGWEPLHYNMSTSVTQWLHYLFSFGGSNMLICGKKLVACLVIYSRSNFKFQSWHAIHFSRMRTDIISGCLEALSWYTKSTISLHNPLNYLALFFCIQNLPRWGLPGYMDLLSKSKMLFLFAYICICLIISSHFIFLSL